MLSLSLSHLNKLKNFELDYRHLYYQCIKDYFPNSFDQTKSALTLNHCHNTKEKKAYISISETPSD